MGGLGEGKLVNFGVEGKYWVSLIILLEGAFCFCDRKVKIVLSVLCLKLPVNAFAFLIKSKKLLQDILSNEAIKT
jgi:hypothetical protein